MNYFELFAIEQNYIIDQKLLQKQYFILQEKYHPDRVKNELERNKNLEYSMLVNEAFKILKDDYLRAEYMLKMKGELLDDSRLKNFLSPMELEEIIDQHELIEELQDLSELFIIEKDKTEACKKLVHDIGASFMENNIKQALDLTVRLKYLTNLVRNIKLKIKNANN